MTGSAKSPEPESSKQTNKRLRNKGYRFITVECPTCRGSGKRGVRVCPLCDGDKVIQVPNE